MIRPRRYTGRSGKRFVLVALLACLPAACTEAPAPTPFSMNEEISLKLFTLAATKFERVSRIQPQLNILEAEPEDKVYGVHVRCSSPSSLRAADRETFVENFLRNRLTLMDADGDEYRPVDAIPRWLYRGFPPSRSVERNFVLVFHVPEVSHTFTLLISNPDPEEGQVAMAAVDLGDPRGG